MLVLEDSIEPAGEYVLAAEGRLSDKVSEVPCCLECVGCLDCKGGCGGEVCGGWGCLGCKLCVCGGEYDPLCLLVCCDGYCYDGVETEGCESV